MGIAFVTRQSKLKPHTQLNPSAGLVERAEKPERIRARRSPFQRDPKILIAQPGLRIAQVGMVQKVEGIDAKSDGALFPKLTNRKAPAQRQIDIQQSRTVVTIAAGVSHVRAGTRERTCIEQLNPAGHLGPIRPHRAGIDDVCGILKERRCTDGKGAQDRKRKSRTKCGQPANLPTYASKPNAATDRRSEQQARRDPSRSPTSAPSDRGP